MNILFITGALPFPPDNGRNIRAFNLIKKLSEKNNLTLLISEENKVAAHRVNAMKRFCSDIRFVPYQPLSGMRLLFRLFLSLFHKEPLGLLVRFHKNMQQEVDFLLHNKQIDAVICDRLTETLYILSKNVKALKIYSSHNIEHLIMRRLFESTTSIFKKVASYIEWMRIENYEKKVWKNFDFSIAVSENDKKIMSEFAPGERIFVVPNGIDTAYFQPKTGAKVPSSIIYTGQMGWHPNEDAVVYFADNIYPLVKDKIPDIKFFIVGSNTTKKVKRLSQKDNTIEVTGRVDDIRTYIDTSAVYIVPLRIGSGTRIKILEALAMKKPVISTSVGCEGLGLADGENILIADKPDEFADKVVSLLRDETTCRRLGAAGQEFVKNKYDWGVVFKELDKLNNRLDAFTGGGR